jgi:hypothetical protein
MLSRFLMTATTLSAFTACVGEGGKLDSADSIPLVADVEFESGFGLRCADPEYSEDCYRIGDIKEGIEVQPGEFFAVAGSDVCPLAIDGPELLLMVNPGGRTGDDGVMGNVYLDVTFDCGGTIPADGELFWAEQWLVGDLGTVLHFIIRGDFGG